MTLHTKYEESVPSPPENLDLEKSEKTETTIVKKSREPSAAPLETRPIKPRNTKTVANPH